MLNVNDPIWGVIGVIATIIFGIAGVVGVVLAFLQLTQNKKMLSYEIQSITPIFRIAKGFQDQIEIKLNGATVRDVYLLIIRFVNSGRASIRPEDFVHPLMISVSSGKVVSAEITNVDPPELGSVIEAKKDTSVTFKKMLLNSKDEFTLNLLVSDFNGRIADIKIEARIDGVKKVVELKDSVFIKALIKDSPAGLLMFPIALSLSFVSAFGSVTLAMFDAVLGLPARLLKGIPFSILWRKKNR